MPFVLLFLGILFLIVAVRGTQDTFFSLLKSEFIGTNSFIVWGAALVILGLLAYVKPIRPAAQAMMGLVLLIIFLANKGGVFSQFNAALRAPATINAPANTSATATPAAAANTPGTNWLGGAAPATQPPSYIPGVY